MAPALINLNLPTVDCDSHSHRLCSALLFQSKYHIFGHSFSLSWLTVLLFILLYVWGCFASMYVCVLHYAVPSVLKLE